MPPFFENHPAVAIITIALVASAVFIGVPVALSYAGLVRRAKRLGVARPGVLVTRRFFIPRKRTTSLASLAGRDVWFECVRLGCTIEGVGRVASITDRTLRIERMAGAELTFVPGHESRSFAAGAGAAFGLVRHDGSEGRGMVVFL